MRFTILDCYTDEPAGLGVPPYIGTYPRYIAGAILDAKHEVFYLTIDDLRFYNLQKDKQKLKKTLKDSEKKTNIKIKNRTRDDIEKILETTAVLIIIAGVHTPGKYLSAVPGTVAEILPILKKFRCLKILTGPATFGSGLYGGRKAVKIKEGFDLIVNNVEYKISDLLENNFSEDVDVAVNYKKIKTAAVKGAAIVKQHPDFPRFLISEIETSRGCYRDIACSFCTEQLKHPAIEFRDQKDIVDEMKALNKVGVKNFRLGKQSCLYSYKKISAELQRLFSGITRNVKYDVLHIDNANPAQVTEEKTKLIVQNCTPGNVAAFGVESFDPEVGKKNNLNATPEQVYKAVEVINKYGARRGANGMPLFLPGINLLFGLIGESKETHSHNMEWLERMLNHDLLLRRINVREVVVFPGTKMEKIGNKFLKKNKKYYYSWRDDIRQKIDWPMLKKVVPAGTVLKKVRTEIHDGNTTFGRQIGTYPLIVGVKKKEVLNKVVNVKIKSHMLRSIVGEII
ncbi:MAG: radical SAM protein [Nanoarchaeota archaeon]|nr:radical SAM protein [Nanoarchaeota archaeon]